LIYTDFVTCENGFGSDLDIFFPLDLNLSTQWYKLLITYTNECGECTYEYEVYYVDDINEQPGSGFSYKCNIEELKDPCCEEMTNLEEVEINNVYPLIIHPISDLVISQSTITTSSQIDFIAGNSLEILNGSILQTNQNGTIRLFIDYCNEEKKSEKKEIYQFITPIEKIIINNELGIYPNPTVGKLFISNPKNRALEIFLHNNHGILVYQSSIFCSKIIELDINFLPKNSYSISIYERNKLIKADKLIKIE